MEDKKESELGWLLVSALKNNVTINRQIAVFLFFVALNPKIMLSYIKMTNDKTVFFNRLLVN
jgi:hypothetical protein